MPRFSGTFFSPSIIVLQKFHALKSPYVTTALASLGMSTQHNYCTSQTCSIALHGPLPELEAEYMCKTAS